MHDGVGYFYWIRFEFVEEQVTRQVLAQPVQGLDTHPIRILIRLGIRNRYDQYLGTDLTKLAPLRDIQRRMAAIQSTIRAKDRAASQDATVRMRMAII